jgi:hypothetical protein
MCHDWWMRREKRRDEQFDEELRYLLDEEGERPGPVPIVEHEVDEELTAAASESYEPGRVRPLS